MRARLGTDGLGEARRLALDHVASGLGRHVVGGQAGAAGGEHEAHVLVGQAAQGGGDRLAVVGQDLAHGVEPRGLAALGQRGAGDVLSPAFCQRGGDGEHRRPHDGRAPASRRQSSLPPVFSTSATGPTSTPRSMPLTMSYTVSAATAQAVIASISTPV